MPTSSWRCRSEQQLHGGTFYVLHLEQRSERRFPLRRLNLRACVSVVDRHRPKQLGGNGQRDRELVLLCAFEIETLAVAQAEPIQRAGMLVPSEHRRRGADGLIEPLLTRFRIESRLRVEV